MNTVPFHYDYVGSFLRPEKLKQARKEYAEGTISALQLKEIEDACIIDLVSKLKDLGYQVITDGEFRRSAWHLDFMWGFDGVSHKKTEKGLRFHDEAAMIDDTFLTDRISLTHEHPFVEHFRFIKALEDENTIAKQTVPAPPQTLAQFWMPFNRRSTLPFYTDINTLVQDIVTAYTVVIKQLYGAGCRNLQLDDCTWGMLADQSAPAMFGCKKDELIHVQNAHKDINNAVIASIPDDMTVTTHVCRGNYHSTYAHSGPYDSVADTLFAKENVDAFYLEFDDERSGGFAPLSKVKENQKVVLGLITSKSPRLENKELVKKRIQQAAKYIPLDRLCLSPQCGFASCEIGNILNEDQQWEKLKLIKEIAEEVWPD